MPLSPTDQHRTSYHLGYMVVNAAASLQLGIPRSMQTQFLVNIAVQPGIIIEDFAVPKVRQILDVMDGIECRLIAAQDRLAITKTGTTEMREDECDALDRQYVNWGSRLSDLIGAPIYIWSERYRSLREHASGNLRVMHS